MGRSTPIFRISAGLALLTASLVLALDALGVLPNVGQFEVERRLQLAEVLASQAAALASRRQTAAVEAALVTAVARDETLLSAGVRNEAGALLAHAGDHGAHWSRGEEPSAAAQIRVPLFKGGAPFGALEVRFEPLPPSTFLASLLDRPLVKLLLLLTPLAFVAYALYMRRTLRYLDPTAVIPTRVQATLDVMAEGVVVIDERERIVMANAAFAERVDEEPAALLGKSLSSLPWRGVGEDQAQPRLPWTRALRESKSFTDAPLRLERGEGACTFSVNGCPVLDGWERAKGVIATFDDVTALEAQKEQLERTLAELEKAQGEVQLQNEELRLLARSDPLTGVANRRAFFDAYEAYYARALIEGKTLSVIMVDIDHFKKVNDEHGHQVGDEVIRDVAEALADAVRETDAVCRYGGEEFVVVLPETQASAAAAVAERLRKHMASPGFTRIPVSASFGVAASEAGASTLPDLINRADEALYVSKRAGRDRVTCWEPAHAGVAA